MPWDDPDFAFNVLRPIAVVSGWCFAIWAGYQWQDRRVRKREERKQSARNITPRN